MNNLLVYWKLKHIFEARDPKNCIAVGHHKCKRKALFDEGGKAWLWKRHRSESNYYYSQSWSVRKKWVRGGVIKAAAECALLLLFHIKWSHRRYGIQVASFASCFLVLGSAQNVYASVYLFLCVRPASTSRVHVSVHWLPTQSVWCNLLEIQ